MNSSEVDDEIRVLLLADEAEALDKIWNSYASDLLGYLVALLCSREEAEDLLQDLFVTVARNRERLASARNFKPYLFRLARNLAYNAMKKNNRRRKREHAAAPWLEPLEEKERDARTEEIEAALSALPNKQRSVVVLKQYRGLSFRQIGEVLAISENTAASRYRYAIEKLRRQLKRSVQ